MIPYVTKHISREEIKLLERIKKVVEDLPEVDLGIDHKGNKVIISCHILTRAMASCFNLKYRDGHFYPNFGHSWIVLPSGNIIDVYPVAVFGGPIIMDGRDCSPAKWLYRHKDIRLIIGDSASRDWFIEAVAKIEDEIRKILSKI